MESAIALSATLPRLMTTESVIQTDLPPSQTIAVAVTNNLRPSLSLTQIKQFSLPKHLIPFIIIGSSVVILFIIGVFLLACLKRRQRLNKWKERMIRERDRPHSAWKSGMFIDYQEEGTKE